MTQTPLGSSGAAYETITQRDQAVGDGTVGAGADIAVTRPVVENSDTLVAIIGKEDTYDITPPSGWVKIDDYSSVTGSVMHSSIWYKVVTNAGSEPASYNFTSNDTSVEEYAYWIGSFSGVDTSSPLMLLQHGAMCRTLPHQCSVSLPILLVHMSWRRGISCMTTQ
ncbi:MAG: hypothetical protein R3B69_00370 [Candidatus Paceibacterota bacterium]